jgi:lysyl-tRNA synthetase, class II
LTGRVLSIRAAGKKLIFYDIVGDDAKIQIQASRAEWKDSETGFAKFHNKLKRGDIIGVVGRPGRTRPGEFSVLSHKTVHLSYCLHILPTPPTTITTLNKDTRYRQRYLDLIVNP